MSLGAAGAQRAQVEFSPAAPAGTVTQTSAAAAGEPLRGWARSLLSDWATRCHTSGGARPDPGPFEGAELRRGCLPGSSWATWKAEKRKIPEEAVEEQGVAAAAAAAGAFWAASGAYFEGPTG